MWLKTYLLGSVDMILYNKKKKEKKKEKIRILLFLNEFERCQLFSRKKK